MKLSDVCNLMNIDINRAKKFIAGILNVSTNEVNVKGTIDIPTCTKLADHFPEHNKVMVLTCNPSDQIEIKLMGSWDGRLMRAATRVFNHSYKTYQKAVQMERPDATFRTQPTKEEIQNEKKEQARRVVEYEIEKGIRKDDGSLKGEVVNKNETKAQLGDQPALTNRAMRIPEPDPIQPLNPEDKQEPMYDKVGHENKGSPEFGSDQGVQIIETNETVIRD